MVDLQQFKDNAKERGICEMIADWDNAKSKKQLMDIALDVRGIEYIATAIAQGWGISHEVIANDFPMFLNGKYTRQKDGYTSQMYCLPPEDKEIIVNSTVTLIIGYNGNIIVNKSICELYIVNSDCVIIGSKNAKVHEFKSKIRYE